MRYGARIASIRVPDRDGMPGEVAVGFDDAEGWLSDASFQGATIGRVANRIRSGRFSVDGTEVMVPCNEPAAALHGGPDGFSQHVWDLESHDDLGAVLRLRSPDGDMGFPGELDVQVALRVHGADLVIDYTATTTAPTPVNLTNHTYFNLTGTGGSVDRHLVDIAADAYLPVGAGLLPTGELAPVAGTAFDLRTPIAVGARWRAPDPQLVAGRGYDHAFVLRDGSAVAARVVEPVTGRTLTVVTDQPALQFYSGGMLDGTIRARTGLLRQGDAFCLEAQGFPDAVHHDHFPSVLLRPGQIYTQRTEYRFGVH
ncbi:galactose-1-epimerase [Nakamurella sp. YIM 132087]|uniref:Aldose 1-epimerase n=2 Tax=Nakamurella alba TaxID=2665158 RepID=A0A7K1FIU9_9ACTN|nr:galactose-1-epimerase [Nakamurella alba]